MIQKYATASVIGVPEFVRPGSGIVKGAHRATFNYTPREGYLYVRSRMISSRCNDNFDEFPADEIKKGHLTFIGKPVFVNHHNDNHRRMRGVIIAVALHEDTNPDGSPDTWVEGLMEVDAVNFPKLAQALIKGEIQRTSMGVDVQYSICSSCGNKASTPAEYCRHIPRAKGQTIWKVEASSGKRRGELIREICHGLRFFENSLLVEPPADPTAFFLGQVEMGPGLDHLTALKSTASVTFGLDYTPQRIPVRKVAHRQVSRADVLGLVEGSRCPACSGLNTVASTSSLVQECFDCEHEWKARTAELKTAKPKHDNPADHPWFQKNPVHHNNILDHWNQATDDEKEQGRRWYEDAHLISTAIAHKHANHPKGQAHVGAGIVANYSPQQGWESNMHNAARVLHEGKGIGGPGSGMFASAHQAKAADRILGGEDYNDVLKGPKIQDFAHLIEHGGDKDHTQPRAVIDRHALSVAAGKRMSTDDYSEFPKTNRHYYGHVVSQYHEAARQISEKEGVPTAAHHVQAATWLVRQRLNQADERAAADAGEDSRLNRGRENARSNAQKGWDDFRNQHFPDLPHAGPGTGYVKNSSRRRAYGETKAPADVNTLRDEACPVCGEATASYDGNTCRVCGFVAPPPQFQDPDLDVAKQMDLRQGDDLGATDVNALEQQTNDRDGDGLDDKTGEPVGAEEEGLLDEQPVLSCSNCGAEFPAGEPQTTDTRDPQAGDMGAGPAEGDVCPECGKGELLDGEQMMAEEEGVAPEEDDPFAEDEENPEEPEFDDEPFPGDGDPNSEEESSEEDDPEEEEDEEEDPRFPKTK